MRPAYVPQSSIWLIREKCIPHVELIQLLCYCLLPLLTKFLQPALQGVLRECICNHCLIVNCLLRMFHSFVLPEQQCILVYIVTNLCERHLSIDLYLHIVSLLPRADIVFISHRCWNCIRVDDPLAQLCGLVCILILIIILIIAVIFTWK